MPLTPETLVRHELIGLHVRVVESTDPTLIGIEGRVVDETMRTLTVESGSRARQVQKNGTTFEFRLTDEAAARRRGDLDERPDDVWQPRKGAGTASEPSGPTADAAGRERAERPAGEDAVYVTVDGARLLSRPERRTETGGNSRWR